MVNMVLIVELGENYYGCWDICCGMVEEVVVNGVMVAKF